MMSDGVLRSEYSRHITVVVRPSRATTNKSVSECLVCMRANVLVDVVPISASLRLAHNSGECFLAH
ncbi:hypothetical protein BD289DRAFT_443147 [Coniella lustricola]|uniref:Uncharacterized protein n=1 Tax=Coniella lustricola TaxID=2025994 RepID=A0A2T2ZXF3_9PEZI|nr:hypothetical protein BD289DRAFT_443147 [Coniella lustricola]